MFRGSMGRLPLVLTCPRRNLLFHLGQQLRGWSLWWVYGCALYPACLDLWSLLALAGRESAEVVHGTVLRWIRCPAGCKWGGCTYFLGCRRYQNQRLSSFLGWEPHLLGDPLSLGHGICYRWSWAPELMPHCYGCQLLVLSSCTLAPVTWTN